MLTGLHGCKLHHGLAISASSVICPSASPQLTTVVVAPALTKMFDGPRRREAARGGHYRVAAKFVNCCPACCPEAVLADLCEAEIFNKPLILFGSPGRIRTSDQPVNSRLLYR